MNIAMIGKDVMRNQSNVAKDVGRGVIGGLPFQRSEIGTEDAFSSLNMLLVDWTIANVVDGDVHEFTSARMHDDILYACQDSIFVLSVGELFGIVSHCGNSGDVGSPYNDVMSPYVAECLSKYGLAYLHVCVMAWAWDSIKNKQSSYHHGDEGCIKKVPSHWQYWLDERDIAEGMIRSGNVRFGLALVVCTFQIRILWNASRIITGR
jgi:hypothetical protein